MSSFHSYPPVDRARDQYAAGNSGAALTLDFALGEAQSLTLTAACTLTLSNAVSGRVYVIKALQDGTGSRAITWPAAVKWPGGTVPTSSGANKTDIYTLYYDGTNFYGSSALNYS